MLGSAKLGMNVRIATPQGYECNPEILDKTRQLAKENGRLERQTDVNLVKYRVNRRASLSYTTCL